MRDDGVFITYHVQHEYSGGRWCDSDVAQFLFDGMAYQECQGAKGDLYREVVRPLHAGWQLTGAHAYLDLDDARRALAHIRYENRERERQFRIVRRFQAQITEIVKQKVEEF